MESRFYYFPGQSPENTKISDRSHALHVSEDTWKRITGHLDRNRLIQEAIEKEAAYKRELKEGSEAMTKTWDNSVENIRRRKEEERLAKIAQLEDDKFKGFYNLRVEQEERRLKFIKEVNKKLYTGSGYPRRINYALLACEVLKERELQLEHQKQIANEDRQDILKEKEAIEQGAEDEKRENAEKAKKLLEKNRAFAEELKKIIEDEKLKAAIEKQNKIEREAKDNIEADNELKEVNLINHAEKIRKRNEIKKQVLKDREEKQAATGKRAKEDKELDEVIEIYKEAKYKIDCMKKNKERELQEILNNRNKVVTEQYAIQVAEKEAIFEEMMQDVLQDDREERRDQAEREKHERLVKEVQENRIKYLEEQAQKKKKENELRKWEILNRYKNEEIVAQYEEQRRKKGISNGLQYKKALLEQMEENKQRIKAELDDMYCINDGDDDQFFEYANETLKIAEKKGLPTYPIRKVITEYKKYRNLDLDEIDDCEDVFNQRKCKTKDQIKKHTRKNKNPCKCCRKEK